MISPFLIGGRAALFSVFAAAMLLAGCGQQGGSNNSNTANGNASPADRYSRTPTDAKPMGQEAPGHYQAGPSGPVSLRFTLPQDGQSIEGNSLAPTFQLANYPVYYDEARKKGQHIHVILDNEPYEADYNPEQPFTPEGGKFNNLKPGLHTLRAFPSREWHESIKEPGAFDFVTFYVGPKTGNVQVNEGAPLLTYSRPKGEYRWKEDPRGVMLDFFVTNANIGINDYKVKYSLDGKQPQLVNRWQPVWWKWEELTPGDHTVTIELIDKDNKPVPFMVGSTNYNRTERAFKILREGEQPLAPAPGGAANSNANANRRR
ncbi:MAG TPA: hypothetical protein VE262_00165 [Blastocatellia bacterium]|nr:hypothetical protein [Blastocatellia bacterium]